jgi:tripartite-type tricarboxylate transporter receptor subunit TctC
MVRIVRAAACLIAAAAAQAAAGGDYPLRPVRVVVGFPAGSGTDMLARFVGARLSERLGRPVVVDNRPGANGILAADLTARAAPDGHTLQFMSISHVMNAAVYPKLPFDPVRSYTPVMQLAHGPLVLVATPSLPPSDVQGLIELARAKPGSVSYAVSGTGGVNHFAGALFARVAGVRLVDVPYKGGPQALTDVMSGQVQTMFGTAAITLGPLRAGRLKALGVSSPKRSPLLPEVPAIAESGVPGYEMAIWWGVLAPAGVPAAIVAKLNAEIGRILAQPESAQRLAADGALPAPSGSAEFGRLLAAETEKWRRVAREAGIRVE